MASPNFPHTGSEAGSMEAQRARMYWIPEVHPSPSCAGSAVEACGFACVQREPGVEVCLGHSKSQCSLIPDPDRSSCQKHRKSPLVSRSRAHSTLPPLPTSQHPKIKQRQISKIYKVTHCQIHTHMHTQPDTPPPFFSLPLTTHTARHLARHTHRHTPSHITARPEPGPRLPDVQTTPTHPKKHTV